MKILLSMAFVVSGCFFGPDLQTYAPAHIPEGVTSSFRISGQPMLQGELLSVDQDGFYILSDSRVVRIPIGRVIEARFDHTRSTITVQYNRVPNNLMRDLPPLSRFPAGIPDAVMKRLLEKAGQTEPDQAGAQVPGPVSDRK